MELSAIQYYTRDQIDVVKWDRCMATAPNGLIYGYSFFLDALSDNWHGLVAGDYDAVMPLPFRKKLGLHYLYQPFLIPVGGVFGNHITQRVVSTFLDKIPAHFKLWNFSLNHFNTIDKRFQQQFKRTNIILPLHAAYEIIAKNYSENINRNISKANKNNCRVQTTILPEAIIDLCNKVYPSFTKVEAGAFNNLKKQFRILAPYAKCYGVVTRDSKLLSACIFIVKDKRAYYWLAVNTPEAKDAGSSALLIDAFIRDHAGSELTFDFEGSDKKSISAFYRQFGGIHEDFTTLYVNRLPFPANYLLRTPAYYTNLVS